MKQWEDKRFFLKEEDYLGYRTTMGEIFRRDHYEEDYLTGADGTRLHYYRIPHMRPQAVIVISHGFCEFVHKYEEMIEYYHRLGYVVYYLDHRGHGFSERTVEAMDLVHVKHWQDYVSDLGIFLRDVVRKENPDRRVFLFGHSMGGAIAAAVLEREPGLVDAAVLSSPMMEMSVGKHKPWFVKALTGFCCLTGRGTQMGPGNRGFDGKPVYETSSAQSKARYDYFFDWRLRVPEYTTYGGSNSWIREALRLGDYVRKHADRVQVPVLLWQAGQDSLVVPAGQELFAERSAQTRLVRFDRSKHEIFNAFEDERLAYYGIVFHFLEEQVNA